MSAVPLGKAGVGSAMNDTTRELGGALGVAILGSLVTSAYTGHLGSAIAGLSDSDQATAQSGLVGAFNVAGRLGTDGAELVAAAKQAFVDGIGVAALTGAVVVALAAIASRRLLPRGTDPGAGPSLSFAADDGADAGDTRAAYLA